MYRKIKNINKNYKKDNILIRKIYNLDEEYSIGNWDKYYQFVKMKYNTNNVSYPNYSYVILENEVIVGYFISTISFNEEENPYIAKYSKKMILDDFGVCSRKYAKHSKLLLDYFIEMSKKLECKVIEIKRIDGFEYFYHFLKRNYKVKEYNDYLYLIIDKTNRVKEKTLKIYEDDNISLENLYFLYGLKFRIYRNKCVYCYNKEKIITVERKTGFITIHSDKIFIAKNTILNNRNRNFIHMICNMCFNDEIKKTILSNEFGKTIYDARSIDEAIIFDMPASVEKNYPLLNKIYNMYDYVYAYKVEFDCNYLLYNTHCKRINIKEYLKSKIKYLDISNLTFIETKEKLIKSTSFNDKLENIRRFDFRMGNSFSGIKKFTILFNNNEIEIKSNGYKDEDYIPKVADRNTIINELKLFYFANWKSEYLNDNPNEDNFWTITLEFENEKIVYKGLDNYPNVWFFVVDFIEKYSYFKLTEKEDVKDILL